MKNLKQYIKKTFTQDGGMQITDEAIEAIQNEIERYITTLTKKTISLGMHKTLMPQDVEFILQYFGGGKK